MEGDKITTLSEAEFSRYYNKALREIDNGIPVEGVVDDFMLLGWDRDLAEEVAYKAYNVRTKSNSATSNFSIIIGLPLTLIGLFIVFYAFQNSSRIYKFYFLPLTVGLGLLVTGLYKKYN